MSIIKKYNLTDTEVRKIVLEWYLLGLEPTIMWADDMNMELDEYINTTYDVWMDEDEDRGDYVCQNCGPVSEVTYCEDRDVDLCNTCK
jgi:hypothetical protein